MVRCLAVMVVLSACSGRHDAAEAPAPGPVSRAVLPEYVPPDAAVADGGAVDANPLLAMFGPPSSGPSSAATIAKLEEQARTAPAAEKVLIGKMIAALRELDAAETDKPHAREHEIAGTKQMVEALRGMLDYTKADVGTQRTLISSLSMVPYQAENMGIGDAVDVAGVRQESLARGRALVKAFPRDARAWKLLGWLEAELADDHGSSLAAMRAYQTCAVLDPSIPECPKAFAKNREIWTEPYCEAADILPGIGWYEEGATVPRFTSKDVVRLQAEVIHMTGGNVYDGTTGKVIDKAPDRDDAIIVLEVAPAAVKPMAEWTRDVQDVRKHYFEIRLGDRMLATTKGTYFEPRERSEWSVSRIGLAELCRAPTQRPLPPDLR